MSDTAVTGRRGAKQSEQPKMQGADKEHCSDLRAQGRKSKLLTNPRTNQPHGEGSARAAGICAQVEIHMYPSQAGNPTKTLDAKSEAAKAILNLLQSNAKAEQCCLPCMYRHCNGVTQPFCLGAIR